MSLIFYYAPMSTASLTEAVLAELGTPCERVKLGHSHLGVCCYYDVSG